MISTRHPIQRKFESLLQSATTCYYKVRQLSLLQSATTSCKVLQVLQSVTILLQSGTGITKCDDCCKVRQNMNIRMEKS